MAGKWPVIERIWRSRGTLPVDEPVATEEAIDRLSVLFDAEEAVIDRTRGRIDYRKLNPAAQDRLATFSNGSVQLVEQDGRKALHFDVGSPALLLTFLAPLLFLALSQGIVALGQWEEAKEAEVGESEEDEVEEEPGELHWFDQMLGAPAPEKPDKDEKDDEEEEDDDFSPEPGYGLAAIFALLYLVGRILEPRLLKNTLRRVLSGPRADAKKANGGALGNKL